MHVLDLRMHDLQALNIEQKQTVDNITDRIFEIEKFCCISGYSLQQQHRLTP